MKQLYILFFLLLLPISRILADSPTPAPVNTYVENTDGHIKEGEFQFVSPNGAVTRRPCPYTCEMRGLPKQHCKVWRSVDGTLCYVWDTRLPQHSVE
jgi:hypothetical protein